MRTRIILGLLINSESSQMIINAGIERVYIRDNKDEYRMIMVQEWIDHDESVLGMLGY